MITRRSQAARVDPEREQEPVIAFLSDPRTYGTATVERIDTHISHIFSAGSRTYKLKRAIRSNFLDYSTVTRRRESCRQEVHVNRRTAPEIYLSARPILRTAAGLSFDGEGPAVDWVVEMVTFDRRLEFDQLAARGLLTPEHVLGLADGVAAFHCAAPRRPEFGGAEAVSGTIGQIAEAISSASGCARLTAAAGTWQRAAAEALGARGPQLDVRRRHGYVRRCHGDLHLGNICLFGGRPTPFDAIEFNEAIASIDVLYDLAFAVMDLLHHGERSLGNLLLNRYLGVTRDYSGLSLMPLFVSMRAAVRAIPAALEGRTGEADALGLLCLARQSLATPIPFLVAVGGPSGSGKSTVSQTLAPALGPGPGAVVLRSDVARKLLEGVAPEERLPAASYSAAMSCLVYRQLRRDAARALRAGVPAILDATFLDAGEREATRRLAGRLDVPFVGLWLGAGRERLAERLRQRGRDASDATPDLLARQAEANMPFDWRKVDADALLSDVVAAARHAIDEVWSAHR